MENVQFTDSGMFVRSGIPVETAYGEHRDSKGWFVQIDRFAWIERKTTATRRSSEPASKDRGSPVELAVEVKRDEAAEETALPMEVDETPIPDLVQVESDVTPAADPAATESAVASASPVLKEGTTGASIDPEQPSDSQPAEDQTQSNSTANGVEAPAPNDTDKVKQDADEQQPPAPVAVIVPPSATVIHASDSAPEQPASTVKEASSEDVGAQPPLMPTAPEKQDSKALDISAPAEVSGPQEAIAKEEPQTTKAE